MLKYTLTHKTCKISTMHLIAKYNVLSMTSIEGVFLLSHKLKWGVKKCIKTTSVNNYLLTL